MKLEIWKKDKKTYVRFNGLWGWSVCHPDDRPSAQIGVVVACLKARHLFPAELFPLFEKPDHVVDLNDWVSIQLDAARLQQLWNEGYLHAKKLDGVVGDARLVRASRILKYLAI